MFRKIKKWYELAETNKWLIVLHILFTVIRVTGLIISPIFVAKVTTCLTAKDYSGAILNLTIEILVMAVSLSSYFQVYCNASRLFGNTYKNVQRKIYKKAYRAKESNFEITSKEKLLNIIGTDIDVIGNFADTLGVKIGKIFQVVLTLVVVFTYNWIVGLAILGLSVINFFILIKLNKGIASHKRSMYENKDKIYEGFSKVLSNQPIIKAYDMGPSYADDYFKKCDGYVHSFKKNKNLTGVKDCLFVLFYKVMIYAITFLMIFLVKNEILSLTLYLVLVSYLLTATELINEIINITASIEECDVSRKRINTVLNFTDAEWIKFGSITKTPSLSDLNLINVSYSNNDSTSEFFGTVKNVDINFEPYSLNLVKGNNSSGKRILYKLITRYIMPSNGKILLAGINIYDYEQKFYKNIVFSAYEKPMFIDGSILYNFNIVEKNRDKINDICSQIGILDYINSLPNGFDSEINKCNLPPEKSFLIGLAITLLKADKIILIHELPQGLSKEEKENLKNLFYTLSKTKTLIIFTDSDLLDDIANKTFLMENGVLKSTSTQGIKPLIQTESSATEVKNTQNKKVAKTSTIKKTSQSASAHKKPTQKANKDEINNSEKVLSSEKPKKSITTKSKTNSNPSQK